MNVSLIHKNSVKECRIAIDSLSDPSVCAGTTEDGSADSCDGVLCPSPANWILMIQVSFCEHCSLLPTDIKMWFPPQKAERETAGEENKMFWRSWNAFKGNLHLCDCVLD